MILCCAVLTGREVRAADTDEQQRINTAVEALTRLENVNLDEKPAVKAAVHRVLAKTRGTPNFVKLVQHFQLTNQTSGLLEVAISNPKDESGVEAMRLVLAGHDLSAVKDALQSTNAARLVEALGNAKDRQVVPLLAPLVTDEARPLEARRAAVRALTQTQDGSASLLALAKAEKLPQNLQFIAATELNSARWPEIKAEAAKVLPLPAGRSKSVV